MKKAVITTVIAFGAALAQASVTLNMMNGVLTRNDGSTPLPQHSTLVLLADANNNGFGDLTLATGSWKADEGDMVLARWNTGDEWQPGTDEQPVQFDYIGLTAGRPLQLVWYDKAYNVADAGPGENVYFGTFRTDDVISNSDIGWNLPSDGATVALNFQTESFWGGASPDSAGRAQFQTIPEPTSIALLALAGLGVYCKRRFNR